MPRLATYLGLLCIGAGLATGSVALAGGDRHGGRTGGDPPAPFLLDAAGGYANACDVMRIRQISGHAQVTLTSGDRVTLDAAYGTADNVALTVGAYITGTACP